MLPLLHLSRQVVCEASNKVKYRLEFMEGGRFFGKLGCCLGRQKTPPSGVELICTYWQALAYNKIDTVYEKPC